MKLDDSLLAVNTMVYRDIPLEEILPSVRRTGLSQVELSFTEGYVRFDEMEAFGSAASARVKSLLADNGISCKSVAAHIDLGVSDAYEKMMRRLEFSSEIGADIVITNSAQVDKEEALVSLLERLSKQIAGTEMMIALENPGDGTGNLLSDGKAGAEFLRRHQIPRIALNFDCNNAFSYNQGRYNVIEDADAALPCSASIHLKDMKQHGDEWFFTAIGEGDFRYDLFFRKYREHGKPLPLVFELPIHMKRCPNWKMAPNGNPPGIEGIEKAIADSIRNVKCYLDGGNR